MAAIKKIKREICSDADKPDEDCNKEFALDRWLVKNSVEVKLGNKMHC